MAKKGKKQIISISLTQEVVNNFDDLISKIDFNGVNRSSVIEKLIVIFLEKALTKDRKILINDLM